MIMSKLNTAINSRKSIYRWQKANSLCSKGKLAEAIEIYSSLALPNGLLQISIAQTANAHNRLGQKKEARGCYLRARQSEQEWGARDRQEDSDYIVRYCEFFLATLDVVTIDSANAKWFEQQFVKLDRIAATNRLKEIYLPMPTENFTKTS
jgi:hypothetical protein